MPKTTITLDRFRPGNKAISLPLSTTWLISDIMESRGKQDLYRQQSPQKLKLLKENAIIESTVSSNRMEGVEVDQERIRPLLIKNAPTLNRNEEEVQGYRNALKWIHEHYTSIGISEKTILRLHELARGEIWDAGKYKEKDGDIIERLPEGDARIRFRTVRARETLQYMNHFFNSFEEARAENWLPAPILIAVANLDFLCIHPFRDGNGRVSRLMWLLQLYHAGFEVGRIISLEKMVEETKERYYETLEESSQGWHQGKNDPIPYINYSLNLVKNAYREFETRVDSTPSPRGSKTEEIVRVIHKIHTPFSLSELEQKVPGASRDMIRKVLRDLKAEGIIENLGRGPQAKWNRLKSS